MLLRNFKNSLICALFLISSACSTVTVRESGKMVNSTEPTWSSSESFFFWGLAGEKHININQICGAKAMDQIQTQRTFLDGFLTMLTVGIYAPRSAKVWCE